MTIQNLTYKEGDKYYALTWTSSGHCFYIGPYTNRSAARRRALLAKGQSQLLSDYDQHLTKEINSARPA